MNSNSSLFYGLVQYIQNSNNYQEILLNLQSKYHLFTFKLQMLDCQTIKKIYENINAKYALLRQLKQNPNGWNQNERKVFIWFIILFIYRQQEQNQQITEDDWKGISITFFNKNIQFLKFQYLNLVKLTNKISWTPQEDCFLLNAVKQEQSGKWYEISQHIFTNSNQKIFKSPKHCRQRFLNHLDDKKKRGNWTPQEDLAIFKFVIQNGKRWCKIVPVLKQIRTEHMIKNRFNSIVCKYQKNKKQRQESIINKIIKILKKQIQNIQNKKKQNLNLNLTNQNGLNHHNYDKKVDNLYNNQMMQNMGLQEKDYSAEAQLQISQQSFKAQIQISNKSSELKINEKSQTNIAQNSEILNPVIIYEQPNYYQPYPFQIPINNLQYIPYNYTSLMPYYCNEPTIYNTFYY